MTVPDAHLFDAGGRHMLLSVASGCIHELEENLARTIERAVNYGDADRVAQFLAFAGLLDSPVAEEPPTSVPLRALSLAVAQKCNLGCTYCYAQQGSFGGPAKSMPLDVAKAAIDRLIDDAPPGQNLSLAFLGGEPLINRAVLRAATEHAAARADAAGVRIDFALTTNATLLNAGDAEFFEGHAFTVTISIDGIGETHDRLRPFKSGQGSFDRVLERAAMLLRRPRRAQVTARVSVTPRNLQLRETLEELIRLGFDGVLFSPVLSAPSGEDQMGAADLEVMLAQLLDCGAVFERKLRDGEIYPFLNVISTLRRIHEKNRDAYPCGAGGGYMGVSSNGALYACHRFVDEDLGAMGDVTDGIDPAKQRLWLSERNVHRQEPCRTCWARYLCSGGCHHEAIHRGRPACDSIRSWLHYCLSLYATLAADQPSLLGRIVGARTL